MSSALEQTVLSEEQVDAWKVLIVDDEPVMHTVTTMVLRGVNFLDRPLTFLSATTAAEARRIMQEVPDVAVAFIDVVMEHDSAGLDLVRWIREELKNRLVRIVLRTGQPGQAPEHEIIQRYEIHDYKEKIELTNTKLITTLVVALRSYQDLMTIERSRQGFRKIIDATATFLNARTVEDLTAGVIDRIGRIVAEDDRLLVAAEGFGVSAGDADYRIIAGTGRFRAYAGQTLADLSDDAARSLVQECLQTQLPLFRDDRFAAWLPSRSDTATVLYVEMPRPDAAGRREVLEVYSSTVGLALENLALSRRMDHAQRETIYLLGEIVERRNESTGNHCRRVGRMVQVIATEVGVDNHTREVWQLGSSLHDIGKIVVPDAILNKPGKLTPDEFATMQVHTTVGHEFLSKYPDELMRSAAVIARGHHERFGGGGYPDGLSGESIPLSARITAIADVFDALTHSRSYKQAWPLSDARDYVGERAGSDFDPDLVKVFLASYPEIERIHREMPD